MKRIIGRGPGTATTQGTEWVAYKESDVARMTAALAAVWLAHIKGVNRDQKEVAR